MRRPASIEPRTLAPASTMRAPPGSWVTASRRTSASATRRSTRGAVSALTLGYFTVVLIRFLLVEEGLQMRRPLPQHSLHRVRIRPRRQEGAERRIPGHVRAGAGPVPRVIGPVDPRHRVVVPGPVTDLGAGCIHRWWAERHESARARRDMRGDEARSPPVEDVQGGAGARVDLGQ